MGTWRKMLKTFGFMALVLPAPALLLTAAPIPVSAFSVDTTRTAAAAEMASVALRGLSPPREAAPGETVVLLWEVRNAGSQPVLLHPRVGIPGDWGLPLPPGPVELAPGAVRIETMVVQVGSGSEAGEGRVSVSYFPSSSPRGSEALTALSFSITVAEQRRLELQLVDAPRHAFDVSYSMTARIFNGGNVVEHVHLVLRDDANNTYSLSPDRLVLEPGQAALVTAQVATRQLGGRPRRLRLTAESTDAEGVNVDATAFVEVVPVATDVEEAYYVFPLRLQLGFDMSEPGWTWSLSGAGRLDDGSSPKVILDLERSRHRAEIRSESYKLVLGDQQVSSPGLIGNAVGGTGVSGSVAADGRIAEFFALQGTSGRTDTWRYGGVLSLPVSNRSDVAVGYVAGVDNNWSGSVWSLRPRFVVDEQFRLDTEYAVHFRADPPHPAAASFGMEAEGRGARTRARLRWLSTGAGYMGAATDEFRWQASLSASPAAGLFLGATVQGRNGGAEQDGPFPVQSATVQLGGETSGLYWNALLSSVRQHGGAVPGRNRTDLQLLLYRRLARGDSFVATLRQPISLEPGATSPGEYFLGWRLSVPRGVVAPYVKLHRPGRAGGGTGGGGGAGGGGGDRSAPALGAGLRIDLGRTDRGKFQLAGEMNDVRKGGLRIRTRLLWDLPGDVAVEARADAVWATGDDKRAGFDFSVKMTIPFDIPVARRPEFAALHGRLLDAAGSPVPGMALLLDGAAAVTDARGDYRFPAVAAGSRWLVVPAEGSPVGFVFDPPLPAVVDLPPGGSVRFDLRLIEAATVRGHVSMPDFQAAGARGRTPVSSVLIVLEKDDGTLRRVVETGEGAFVVDGLAPGRWRVAIGGDSLGGNYETPGFPAMINLEPGGEATILVEVRPVQRRLHFLDDVPVEVRPRSIGGETP